MTTIYTDAGGVLLKSTRDGTSPGIQVAVSDTTDPEAAVDVLLRIAHWIESEHRAKQTPPDHVDCPF